MTDDDRIIEQFRERDERALENSIKKYGGYCRAIANGILGNAEDTEEILNDTWLHAWNAIPPAHPESLRAYLGVLTRNLAITKKNTITSKKRGGGEVTLVLDELAECVAAPAAVEDEVEERELASHISDFLKSLSLRDRAVFVARCFEGLPTRAVADRYGLGERHVCTLLSRMRKKLAKYLKEVYGDEKY